MTVNNGEPVVMHYGVKGMKWGVTKKPTNSEITDARLDVAKADIKYNREKKKIKSSDLSRSEKRDELRNLKLDALANPDRLTAMKLTTGEKYVAGGLALFATPIMAPAAAGYAVQRGLTTRQVKKAIAEKGVS